MPSDPGDVTDAPLEFAPGHDHIKVDSDGVVDLSALREAATPAADEAVAEDGVSLEEVLFQYRQAILDLNRRLELVEARPTFAAAVGGRRTGH